LAAREKSRNGGNFHGWGDGTSGRVRATGINKAKQGAHMFGFHTMRQALLVIGILCALVLG